VIASGNAAVANGVLGTVDPSLLLNDTYRLRLVAYGTNGRAEVIEDQINIEGELKLGNFRLSFTDLAVPVTGIPISLTRTYDTLTANQQDDFGYGWRMEFRDTDLRTSLGKRSEAEEELGRYPAFKDNTKVFITLPGGKREAYTFKAKRVEYFQEGGQRYGTGNLANYLYEATFESEKGSTNKLTVEKSSIFTRNASGSYSGFQGQPFNPADTLFGGVYVLTSKDGSKYRIDAATGDLLTVQDTNGNTLTYSDSEIKSSTGQKVTFERDAQGRIVAVKDPMGELLRYGYDAQGDLVSVTDQEKNVTKFVYDATYDDPNIAGVNDGGRSRKAHYLREVIDPLNRSGARLDYDPVTGRLIKTTNAAGQTIETSYDPDNSIQVIKDAAGNPTEYEYDIRGNVVRQTNAIGATVSLKYEDVNNPTSVTETRDANGIVTKYEYDLKGNLTWKTEGYCGCAGVVPGKTYYTYDSFGNMTNLVLPTGASMVMDYDSKGQMLFMKDGKGNVIQAFTYYENGLTKTETDTSGTSQYFYNDLGDLTKSIDPDGSITTMSYDFNGKLKRMVEDKGTPNDLTDDEVSTFDYDKLGREKLADYGDGIWVKYDYEGAGGDWSKLEAPTIGKMERKLTADGKLAGWVTPSGGTPTFIYDNAGRLWKETDEAGVVTTEYSYDRAGRVSSVKDVQTGAVASKQYDLGNRVTEEVDPLLGFVRYEYYDARNGGKLKSTTRGQYVRNAAGDLVVDTTVALQTTSFEYNGSSTTVIDAQGRRTTAVQNAYALPTETIFENRNGKDYKATQSYLYANNLQEAKDYPTRIVDIGGNDRVYTYDTTGRLKTATDLGDGVYSYTYGDDGLAVLTSPDGETLSYGYDDLGNLNKITYGDGTFRTLGYDNTTNELKTITLASTETITYTADDTARTQTQTTSTGLSTVTQFTEAGAIKSVTDNTGTTTYRYNTEGGLAGIDMPNGGSVSYTYDILGRVKTLKEKASTTGVEYTTEYDYDTFGNLVRVKDPAQGITTMKYDTLNRLKERNLPNGMKTEWGYDALDRIETVIHKDAQGLVISSVSYERKASGEPVKITREDGTYTKLQYDAALRVTNEQFYNTQNVLLDERTYVYDNDGKRIATISAIGTRTYNYTDGYQLDSITATGVNEDYDYDVNGRMDLMQRDGQSLDLDHDVYDRLTAVKNLSSGTTTNYIYDGGGRRVKATSAGNERYFLVTPASGSGLESTDLMFDQVGNISANYIYAGGYSPFMKLDASGNPVYYLTDGMGSVIGMANQSGQSVAKFSYDSFGNIRNQSGSLADATGGDFRFQGQWLESATGIYHFRARDYDSKTGNFLSRDPVDPNSQEPEAMNPYQAMYNNPYVYSDPTGLVTIMELNISFKIQDILNASKTYTTNQIKQYAFDKIGEAATGILVRGLQSIMPATFNASSLLDTFDAIKGGAKGLKPSAIFERLAINAVCSIFGNIASDAFRFDVRYNSKNLTRPITNGFTCEEAKKGLGSPGGGRVSIDYMVKPTKPTELKRDGWLVGDFKFSVKDLYAKYVQRPVGFDQGKQWGAITQHAKRYQYVPVTTFVTWNPGNNYKDDLERLALKSGVAMIIISLRD
jgi:RHS repeat-associated protein